MIEIFKPLALILGIGVFIVLFLLILKMILYLLKKLDNFDDD